ncbi:hypothetical protein HK104_008929 [Borealophlyctis nickersoniae]|nr:hypothetical protein HK104_008929 [Borealophlyctis nickersoniae]
MKDYKPFKCAICQSSFRLKKDYVRHFFTHGTPPKPQPPASTLSSRREEPKLALDGETPKSWNCRERITPDPRYINAARAIDFDGGDVSIAPTIPPRTLLKFSGTEVPGDVETFAKTHGAEIINDPPFILVAEKPVGPPGRFEPERSNPELKAKEMVHLDPKVVESYLRGGYDSIAEHCNEPINLTAGNRIPPREERLKQYKPSMDEMGSSEAGAPTPTRAGFKRESKVNVMQLDEVDAAFKKQQEQEEETRRAKQAAEEEKLRAQQAAEEERQRARQQREREAEEKKQQRERDMEERRAAKLRERERAEQERRAKEQERLRERDRVSYADQMNYQLRRKSAAPGAPYPARAVPMQTDAPSTKTRDDDLAALRERYGQVEDSTAPLLAPAHSSLHQNRYLRTAPQATQFNPQPPPPANIPGQIVGSVVAGCWQLQDLARNQTPPSVHNQQWNSAVAKLWKDLIAMIPRESHIASIAVKGLWKFLQQQAPFLPPPPPLTELITHLSVAVRQQRLAMAGQFGFAFGSAANPHVGYNAHVQGGHAISPQTAFTQPVAPHTTAQQAPATFPEQSKPDVAAYRMPHGLGPRNLQMQPREGLPRMVQSPQHFSMGFLDGENAGETPDGAGDADAKKRESEEYEGKVAKTIRTLREVFPTQMEKKQRRKPQRRTKHILMQHAEQSDDNEDDTTGAGYGTHWPVSSIPAVEALPRMSEAARASLDGVAVRSNHRQRRIIGRSGGDGHGGNQDDANGKEVVPPLTRKRKPAAVKGKGKRSKPSSGGNESSEKASSIELTDARMPIPIHVPGVVSINVPDSVGANKLVGGPVGLPLMIPLTAPAEMQPTTVLLLLNMVTPEELVNDEDYHDIIEDIRDECTKFGTIRNITIPRPVEGREVAGVGKIFVQYADEEQCGAALRALAGRQFADRTVIGTFYDEKEYEAGEF